MGHLGHNINRARGMNLLRRQLEKISSQKIENLNHENISGPSGPVAQSQNNLPANPHKHCNPEVVEGGPVSGPVSGPVVAQGSPDLQDAHLGTLPQALVDWMLNPKTQGGDEWPIPEDLLPMFDDLVTEADAMVRERDPRWRIQRGYKSLRLKAWVWDSEPPPYRRPKTKSRFGVRR
jgi:hypothetical protein